ncbi:MAG: hypothetical protein ACOY3P_11845 [Planctomycetota bacterium]
MRYLTIRQIAIFFLVVIALQQSLAAQTRPTSAPAAPVDKEKQKAYDQSIYWVRHLDANRNNTLEPSEVTGGKSHSHKDIFEGLAKKAGLPPTAPMSVDPLKVRLAAYHGVPAPPVSSPGAAGQLATQAMPGALVPGFGVTENLPPVPGFGTPSPETTAAAQGVSGTTAPPVASVSADSAIQKRVREVADYVLKKYDGNHNKRLERDEWKGLRDPQDFDRNRDNTLTSSEIAAYAVAYVEREQRAREAKEARKRREQEEEEPRFWRVSTPVERLPEGLPDWFVEKDANLDGQVCMAEHTTTWSESAVADFFRYDLNRDGMITPAECLKAVAEAEEQGEKVADVRSR